MASAKLVAKLKELGNTPIAICAQSSRKTGKGGKVIKYTNQTLAIVPASEALETIKSLRELYPGYGILAQIEGGEHYYGRPVHFYPTAKACNEAIESQRAEERKEELAKADKKLTAEQRAAIEAEAVKKYLAAQRKKDAKDGDK